MKIKNIHKRIVEQPKEKVAEILTTLSSENDKIWPNEKWPRIKFKNGIKVGTKGGHGPIRYSVEKYNPKKIIQFRFNKPAGFNGIHKFEINEIDENKVEVKHTIDMITTGKGTFLWFFAIRALHNALLEDALNKLENNFLTNKKVTEWSFWVKFMRKVFAKK